MNDNVEQIKQKLDIVDFISQYLTLKKAGVNYKAPCPFHNEKTPSLMISAEKQIYKCFGCGESGDIFSFVMKMEGLNFPEALEILANRAGIIIDRHKSPEIYQKEKDIKSRLYKINTLSAQVYNKILLTHESAEGARKYLEKRKITTQIIKDFSLGYAPPTPILQDFLAKRGFKFNEIRDAGSPDRFKNRIIFPIADQMNNVVGFTGRVLDPNDQPKYLNTPETTIFHKGRVLYGLNLAKQHIKNAKSAVIVEGQMDVISSHIAGVQNAVASSGTALTIDHLEALSRYTSNIIFAFDQDLAGENAAKKSIQMAIKLGLNAKTIIIPKEFKDAGDIVEKDPNLWKEIIEKSINVLDWLLVKSFEKINGEMSGQEKKEIAKEILPFLAIIPDKIEQQHYIKILAQKLSTREEIIVEAINRVERNHPVKNDAKSAKQLSPEENLIGLLFIYPELIKKTVIELDYKEFSDADLAEIYKMFQTCYTKENCPINSDKKLCDSSELIGNCLKTKFDNARAQSVNLLSLEVTNLYQDYPKEDLAGEIEKNILRIKNIKNESVKEKYSQAISKAEKDGNIEELKKLLKEFQNALK
jgi:DNA primase